MAGKFYSLKEAAEKLNKTTEEVKALAKQGKLREFRDGSNLLFKTDEVEALMVDKSIVESKKAEAPLEQVAEPTEKMEFEEALEPEQESKPKKAKTPPQPAEPEPAPEEEILLAPETGAPTVDSELTSADTALTGGGISALGETDRDYKLTDDTMAETTVTPGATGTAGMSGSTGEASLEEIEEGVELDAFGSGSGLLDLSLQADDTSLGGILDEIYTSEGGEEGAGPAAEAATAEEIVAETEAAVGELPEEELAREAPIMEAPAIDRPILEMPPDALSKSLGIMLFLPLLAIVYAAIVTISGLRNVMPSILSIVQTPNLPLYLMGGLLVAAGIMFGVGYMTTGGLATRPKKPKEPKKPKAPKKPKEPKKKKSKKGKEEASSSEETSA
jgi:excisionase family DNA binding protein